MKLVIKENKGCIRLIDSTNEVELMVAIKHDLNGAYKIIDFRLTDEYVTPTEYLSDFATFCSVLYSKYEANKDKFDFPIKVVEKTESVKVVRWRDMNGILLGGDKKDKEFDFKTEGYEWSRKRTREIIKEAKDFWENHTGDIMTAKVENPNKRVSEEDFW
jgi:hypothetical protein